MGYPPEAVERTMKVQEVLLRAMSGELRWLQAADILGWSPRTVRRWRRRYERWGYDGLWDRRRRRPSPRRAPLAEVERLLRLYRERYRGFNGRHFHEVAGRDHGGTLSYTFVKTALQGAGPAQAPAPGAAPDPPGAPGLRGGVAPPGREPPRLARALPRGAPDAPHGGG